jgi:hypothetical protein
MLMPTRKIESPTHGTEPSGSRSRLALPHYWEAEQFPLPIPPAPLGRPGLKDPPVSLLPKEQLARQATPETQDPRATLGPRGLRGLLQRVRQDQRDLLQRVRRAIPGQLATQEPPEVQALLDQLDLLGRLVQLVLLATLARLDTRVALVLLAHRVQRAQRDLRDQLDLLVRGTSPVTPDPRATPATPAPETSPAIPDPRATPVTPGPETLPATRDPQDQPVLLAPGTLRDTPGLLATLDRMGHWERRDQQATRGHSGQPDPQDQWDQLDRQVTRARQATPDTLGRAAILEARALSETMLQPHAPSCSAETIPPPQPGLISSKQPSHTGSMTPP